MARGEVEQSVDRQVQIMTTMHFVVSGEGVHRQRGGRPGQHVPHDGVHAPASRFLLLLTAGSMVGGVNSVVMGVFARRGTRTPP